MEPDEVHTKPSILVIAGPSGGGKTTLRRKLIEQEGTDREFLVSYTTRLPRVGEVDGKDYHFLILPYLAAGMPHEAAKRHAKMDFDRLVKQGDVLFEHTSLYGNHYGTPREQLENGLAAGKQMIADVDLNGLHAFHNAYHDQVRSVFLMPEFQVLKQRLDDRFAANEAHLAPQAQHDVLLENQTRLRQAITIMGQASHYDHVILQHHNTPQQTFEQVRDCLDNAVGKSWVGYIDGRATQQPQMR